MAHSWPSQEVPMLVNQIYLQVLDRGVLDHNGNIADPAGLMMHGCQLMNGQASVRDIVRELAMSPEYANKFIDTVSPQDALAICFERLLGRPIDDGARHHYGDLCHHQHCSIKDVISDVINSAEYTAAFGDNGIPNRNGVMA